MNCQPGDLAICVNTVQPQNEGLIVRVIRHYVDTPEWNLGTLPAWWCECSQPMVWHFPKENNYKASREGPVPDRNLRPIRPSPSGHPGTKHIERVLEHVV